MLLLSLTSHLSVMLLWTRGVSGDVKCILHSVRTRRFALIAHTDNLLQIYMFQRQRGLIETYSPAKRYLMLLKDLEEMCQFLETHT
jgi:hypothetical protein